MNNFDSSVVKLYDKAQKMIKWLAVSAMLLSQAVWVYAQSGLVICIHSDGEMRTEPAGDLCCDTPKGDRHEEETGTWLFGSDDCACTDYALSFTAPPIPTPSKLVVPTVETQVLSPVFPLAPLGEVNPQVDATDHGPPRAGPLHHLRTEVLRI